MQKLLLALALVLETGLTFAQSHNSYDPHYHFQHSGNLVADKNFYLLTTIAHAPGLQEVLAGDDSLAALLHDRVALIRNHVADTCRTPGSLLDGFRWSQTDSLVIDGAIRRCYARKADLFDALINRQLRPSGCYQRFTTASNLDLLLHAWGQYITGINYVIDQYGLGKKLRYPAIDAASYDVQGGYYRGLLKTMFSFLTEQTDSMRLFFQPSLIIAMQLMRANDRDEPARFEPLGTGENRKAVAAIAITNWGRYKYAAILVPGEGPELTTVPFDPIGRMRCDLAAARYRQGLAPFIIVSGGYCHPFHTPWCEAVEMKKYLVGECGLPESAVIIEPQARHTTTNFRNGSRLMIRYGIPVTKAALCVTTKDQTDYIANRNFDRRNMEELGYLPYKDKQQLSPHETVFFPVMDCLQTDPTDPLDP